MFDGFGIETLVSHAGTLMQLRFTHCDQLVAGLAPAGVHPCWTHTQKGPNRYRLGPFLKA
jgi:hypothetical protein